MSPIVLLDTNIISHIMRQPDGPAAKRANELGVAERLCTSVVVQSELLFGLEKNPSKRIQSAYNVAMAGIDVLPLENNVAPQYARIRAALESGGKPIGANDLLIAAHALALEATLVTDNETEFRRVPGLRVENWLTNDDEAEDV